jgi:hypothetical protein
MENDKNNNAKLETRVEHVLISKIKLIWAIVLATVGVAGLFYKIEIDSQAIKTELANHEQTTAQIQSIKDNDLKEIHLSLDRLEQLQIQSGKDIVRLQTLMEQYLQKK